MSRSVGYRRIGAAVLAAAGVGCFFLDPGDGPRREAPTATTADASPSVPASLPPPRQSEPAASAASIASVTVAKPSHAPTDLDPVVHALLFDSARSVAPDDVARCVADGRFTRSEATREILRRLVADARSRGALVAAEDAAVALRADDGAARSFPLLDLAQAYFEVEPVVDEHARLRVLLFDWPATRAAYVAIVRSDAAGIERRVTEAVASGDPAALGAVKQSIASFARNLRGPESEVAVRALVASTTPEIAARALVDAAELTRNEYDSFASALADLTLGRAVAKARDGARGDGSTIARELLRLALDGDSVPAKRLALSAFTTEFGEIPSGRETLESMARHDRDPQVVLSALNELGHVLSPTELLAFGKDLPGGSSNLASVAVPLVASLENHPDERERVVEVLRAALQGRETRDEDGALAAVFWSRITELEPEVRALAERADVPEERRRSARPVLESLQGVSPPDPAGDGEPADSTLIAVVRVAETSVRNVRLEGLTRFERFDRERGEWTPDGEVAFTAHFPGARPTVAAPPASSRDSMHRGPRAVPIRGGRHRFRRAREA